MAADSMSTEAAPLNAGQISKHETSEKIVVQKDLVWGSSGSVGVKQVIQNEIDKDYGNIYVRNISATDLRLRLVKKIQPILKDQYRLVGELTNAAQLIPYTNFIFGVHLNSGFHLINIESNVAGEVVEACHCATGSGQKTGQALLRRLRHQQWDVRTALVVAYRTLNDAIHVEPAGIGPPIQLAKYYSVTQNHRTEMRIEKIEVDSAEYKEIADAARAWMGLEEEALESLKARATAPPRAADPIPEPAAAAPRADG
jgi:hypothetical protein